MCCVIAAVLLEEEKALKSCSFALVMMTTVKVNYKLRVNNIGDVSGYIQITND